MEHVDFVDERVFIRLVLAMIFVVNQPDSSFLVESSEKSNEERVDKGWKELVVYWDLATFSNIPVFIVPNPPRSLSNLDCDDSNNEDDRDWNSNEELSKVSVPH